ncbi:Rv2231c family pyridoxal phosphate-dependent protein CobC [Actinocrispum wychmicini]|uniref:Aminotransferase n=1 Tax=Actinocrispum wychmicini TaxID=1213861 RepID=A0A4R2JIU7_9PSEU|nr:Rv2231c family pyridoxal phosphate-dependent protein CobC [Actinocrispum wychmicini]TCO58697.1 histidinol-phosphate aminotransferase [Actinocrispum wychmicini]
MTSEDLRHHGDRDTAPGMLDFAVNVWLPAPPRWLRDRLAAAIDRLATYPSDVDDLAAREAVAARHGRGPDEVLVLNGSAEGFALLPNLRPRLAAIVHPQFTEPEVALRTAGVPVRRVMLSGDYVLRPELVPDEADMVVIGNPTNPTSVTHPAALIRRLARPGRIVVVDEAFMDAIPGEPESLSGDPRVLVFRSLTKTWALAGLRAGYALGAPEVLARLAVDRPQWPVGSLVLEAVSVCCSPGAVAESTEMARKALADKDDFVTALTAAGIEIVVGPTAPFVLVRVPDGRRLREALRDRKIAVRRGETFPGLTVDHIRLAVRPQAETTRLLEAWRDYGR